MYNWSTLEKGGRKGGKYVGVLRPVNRCGYIRARGREREREKVGVTERESF